MAHQKLGGVGAAVLQPPQIEIKKKNTNRFADKMISHVLGDLPFSRVEPLKAADVLYIRILTNNIKNLECLKRKFNL